MHISLEYIQALEGGRYTVSQLKKPDGRRACH